MRFLRTPILDTGVDYTKMDLIKSEIPQDFSIEYGKAWKAGSGAASKKEEACAARQVT